jgi:hypothetical protein
VAYGRDALGAYRDRPRAQEALIVALRQAALSGKADIEGAALESDMRLVYQRSEDEYVRAGVILSTGELWRIPDALAFLRHVVDAEWRSYTTVVTYPLADIARKDPSRARQAVETLLTLAIRPEIDRGAFLRVVETLDKVDRASLSSLAANEAVRDRGFTPLVDAVIAQRR